MRILYCVICVFLAGCSFLEASGEAVGVGGDRGQAVMKVSFDIGGVLSKYPQVFRPFVEALQKGGAEVYILTDMKEHAKAMSFVQANGYSIPSDHILCANYRAYGETCKARLIEEFGIDIHVDDFPGYCAHTKCVSLFVWPNPEEPYYHEDFKTDDSEGEFGHTGRRPRGHR